MVVWIQNPFDNLPAEGFRKQRYWMMAEAFVRAGHRVVLWTSDFSHARKAKRASGRGGGGDAGGVEVRLIPTPPYRSTVSLARVRSHRAYARAWRLLAVGAAPGPDLVVTSAPTLSAASAALDIGRACGAKVAVDVMDAWPETFERLAPRGFGWLARLALAPLRATARRLYREADLVTGVAARYRALTGRADYHLAYHGIEGVGAADGVRPPHPGEAIRLVYAGNLGRTYDLGTVVRAVEANADFELDVAGFGVFSSACPRVRFHGLLSGPDLDDLLKRCDVGLVPMTAESWVGVPYKFCDYAKAGLAIVSSLGGESADLLARHACGTTYRAGDADSLAAAVRRAARLDRGASRRMCAREFDAVGIYDAYVRVCQDLVKSRPSV